MGSNLSTVSVIFDTSSDWLVIEDTACGTCEGDRYDASRSGKLVSQEDVTREYGSIEFTALEYVDKICILPSTCITSQSYLAIQS